MENLTLSQIAAAITFVVGLISGVGFISSRTKVWIKQSMAEQFISLENRLNALDKRLDQVDLEACKNYLVQQLSNVEKGGYMDDFERQRFYEEYEHYQKLGGNSYIKRKKEELEANNRL